MPTDADEERLKFVIASGLPLSELVPIFRAGWKQPTASLWIALPAQSMHALIMFELTPIAYVSSPRDDLADDEWGAVESTIELTADFGPEAFDGLEEFSHAIVVYLFDRVLAERVERGSRHPRGNPAWPKVGIFAQRGKDRPNRLGVSTARLLRRDGRRLFLQGLDAIHGTPVLDLKPVMREFLPAGEIRQPAWTHELMAYYWRR